MSLDEIKNLPESIRARLRNKDRSEGRPPGESLRYYLIERFIARLGQSSHCDKFVLKGALLYFAWGLSIPRPTRDIDLLGFGNASIDEFEKIVREICGQEVEPDGVEFDPATVAGRRIREGANYPGIRITFQGQLGKSRLPMQIDIGFGDRITPEVLTIDYPNLLAEMSVSQVQGYPPETVIAEKLQAMVVLGSINSRMRDFFDVWYLARQFDFDGSVLQEAILNTFSRRTTTLPVEIPIALTTRFAAQKQTQWAGFLGQFPQPQEEIFEFEKIVTDLRRFLMPLLDAINNGVKMNKKWDAAENWQD